MEYFGTNLSEHGHYRWDINGEYMVNKWMDRKDLPFNPDELTHDLPKGEVVFYQGGGYTVLGIAGSPKDTRPGTKSIFWVKENLSRQEMIERIKSNPVAMKLITAMPFKTKEPF